MIRPILKGLLPKPWLERLRAFMDAPRRFYVLDRHLRLVSEAHLREIYQDQQPAERFRSPINRHEMRAYSQNGEDGILLYIFSQIGTTNRRFIEFGVADGTECNCANLAINFGWHGLMLETAETNVAAAKRYYRERLVDRGSTVQITHALVTAENVNALFQQHGFEGEIDLLSVDIDGNDYWVWRAIDAVNPRVVVVEYNGVFGSERSVAVKYDPTFDRSRAGHDPLCFGASLAALTRLGEEKGYILVGCDSCGVNAFFVRKDCAVGQLESRTPGEAFYPFRDRLHGLVTPDYATRIDSSFLETV